MEEYRVQKCDDCEKVLKDLCNDIDEDIWLSKEGKQRCSECSNTKTGHQIYNEMSEAFDKGDLTRFRELRARKYKERDVAVSNRVSTEKEE